MLQGILLLSPREERATGTRSSRGFLQRAALLPINSLHQILVLLTSLGSVTNDNAL